MSPTSALRVVRRIGGLCALVCACAGCVQRPVAPTQPVVPAPAPPAAEAPSPQPKLRGIKPAELPREEPGVGVGGLNHEAGPAPAQ